MPISIERHATSKIRKVEDLENTYTMGFRGEALASISAISEMTMISKTLEETTGYKIQTTAGDVIDIEECGAQTGTTIIVEKLFFNTPVRYKFLKQDATENKYIKEWTHKVALANPNISFTCFFKHSKLCLTCSLLIIALSVVGLGSPIIPVPPPTKSIG